jgi:hypothetical protein
MKRQIIGIDVDKEIVVQREWVEGLLRVAELVDSRPEELSLLLGYVSSAKAVLKFGELTR